MIRASILLSLLPLIAFAAEEKAEWTDSSRKEAMERARLWFPTDIPSKDLLAGPQDGRGYKFREEITCTWTKDPKGKQGMSPKFYCLPQGAGPNDDPLKIKFGRKNGETYAEIAATRLLWALGFPADAHYGVRITCLDCPENLKKGSGDKATRLIDLATVEVKYDAKNMETKDDEGWGFGDLSKIKPELGGADRAQRDAYRLLMGFIMHRDNGARQQKIVCPKDAVVKDGKTKRCTAPIMMVNDLGSTFAGNTNALAMDKMDLKGWRKTRVWDGDKGCTININPFFISTLGRFKISRAGQLFLSDLLVQLSREQVRDMFVASQVEAMGEGTVDDWVDAYYERLDQLLPPSHTFPGRPAGNGRLCPENP